MKKIITILLSMVLLLAFTACGGGSDSSSSDKSKETEAPKIEKNIDAAAEALGLTGGEETMYAMIGATAGKEYNDGAVELYQFEEDSAGSLPSVNFASITAPTIWVTLPTFVSAISLISFNLLHQLRQ